MAGFVFSRCEEPRCELYSEPFKRGALCLVRLGVSTYEISDSLGISRNTLGRWMKAAGLSRGKGGGCVARNNEARSSKAAPERMARVRDAIGWRFEVVRETRKYWFILRCRECGHEFERFVDLHYRTECPECHRREVERREVERKTASARRAVVRAFRTFLRSKEREEREREFLDTVHVCKECGREFTLRELREDNPWNFTSTPTFCCSACSKRFHKREQRHRRRELCEHSGESVSLLELEERDKHTCYLCGCTTDRSDYAIDSNGNFTAGPTYPSIDHVIPLSLGGEHSMKNARLACVRCNSIKGTMPVEQAMELIAGLKGVA